MLVSANVFAHAYIMQPPSRDTSIANLDARAHKTGPCGGSPRGMPTQLAEGATITVKWQETIGHRGCFQIALGDANDQNFTVLKQIDDPANNPDDMIYTDTVTLPAGMKCENCTLRVVQLMINRACVANEPIAAGDTYFSCADVRIGEFPDAGPTMPPMSDDGGTTSSSSSSGSSGAGNNDDAGATNEESTSSSSGSSSQRRLNNTPTQSGCSVATVGGAGGVGAGLAVLGFAALARRRRRRS